MRQFYFPLLVFVSFLLAGCGLSTPVAMKPMRTYMLNNIKPTVVASRHRSAKTLLVTLPVPNSGLQSNKLVYEPLPFDLRYYADHQWAAPPAQMLLPILAQAIRNQGYFKAVVTTPYSGVSDYYLSTRLMALSQNFLQPESREHVVLQETLSSNKTNQVVASRQFSVFIVAPQNNAYSGVVAANKAVGLLSRQIARWTVKQAS